MARLQVLTFDGRTALELLGLDAECGCGKEIGAVSPQHAQDPSMVPLDSLFAQDGNAVYCAECCVKASNEEVAQARRATEVAQSRRKILLDDIRALTSEPI